MSAAFAASPGLLALFALAAALAMAAALRHARGRGRLLAALQLPLAALLLAALLWPAAGRHGTLRVLNGPAPVAFDAGGTTVALPTASPPRGVARVPDLATALRRFPDAGTVHVLGAGLAPHDRAALGSRRLVFTPAPASELAPEQVPAFTALQLPAAARPGAPWIVSGRVAPAAGTIELLDPAGAVLASSAPDARGGFALEHVSRGAGPATFRLRLRQEQRTLAETDVPVAATAPPSRRVLLLATAPSPELKFLRRWALDAGVELESRIALAPTLSQRRGAAALDAAALAGYDLLIVDERSWAWLAPQRDALAAALRDGLGLLLRVTGPLPRRVAEQWQALGVRLQLAEATPRPLRLTPDDAPLHAWQASFDGALTVPGWHDAGQQPLAGWRASGQGRVGAVWLADSFRLHTRGAAPRHAALWAALTGTLLRARGTAPPRLLAPADVGRRATLCELPEDARVRTPDGVDVPLLRFDGCAAFWPRQAGWHRVVAADVEAGAGDATQSGPAALWWFAVPPPADAAARLAADDARATVALADDAAAEPARASPWRWREALLLAALALAALTWWLERRWRPLPA